MDTPPLITPMYTEADVNALIYYNFIRQQRGVYRETDVADTIWREESSLYDHGIYTGPGATPEEEFDWNNPTHRAYFRDTVIAPTTAAYERGAELHRTVKVVSSDRSVVYPPAGLVRDLHAAYTIVSPILLREGSYVATQQTYYYVALALR